MNTNTRYFQNCLGVFQGGGCRGAAFVGAYRAAYEKGVFFSEVAGASAGSIVSVLIGAGASPNQLEEIIRRLDFNKFLKKPVKLSGYTHSRKIHILKPIAYFSRKIKQAENIYKFLGLYDSSYLSEWIEAELQNLLKKNTTIKFSDLVVPTTVISTDLKTLGIKIWSSHTTPNEDVSYAVRASCNIPIFFQPVDLRYVDGGMLSNLPSFVFMDKSHSIYDKVLAFTLENDERVKPINNFESYLNRIVNTSIEGSSKLQLDFQKNTHIIKINTGTISSTDFDKIDSIKIEELLDSGSKATSLFFEDEIVHIRESSNKFNINQDFFQSYNHLVNTINENVDEILISDINTKWVYELFPTLLNWRMKDCKIGVILKNNNDDEEHGAFRQRFLKVLGANVETMDIIPFRGFIVSSKNANSFALIYNSSETTLNLFHSRIYYSPEDQLVIKLMRNEFLNSMKHDIIASKAKVTIEEVRLKDIEKDLKQVSQYSKPHVTFEDKLVKIEDLWFITKYVRGFKYRQIKSLFSFYKENNIEFFKPAKLILGNSKYTYITPPIIEKIAEKYYVIEGNTRLLYAFRNNIPEINVIIVKGINDILPSTGKFRVHELLLTDKEKVGLERYEGFEYKRFRKIEKAMRDPKTCLIDNQYAKLRKK